jgi:predicted RNase H-like nuclease (RuvC/YqgF family)
MSKYKAKINTLDRKLIVVDSEENDSEYVLNDKDIRNYKKEIATLKRKLPFVDSNPKERKEMQLEIARLQKIIDS